MGEQVQILKMSPDTLRTIDAAREAYGGRPACWEDPARFEVAATNLAALAEVRRDCNKCPLRLPCLFDGVKHMAQASENDRENTITASSGVPASMLRTMVRLTEPRVRSNPRVPEGLRETVLVHSVFAALCKQRYPKG